MTTWAKQPGSGDAQTPNGSKINYRKIWSRGGWVNMSRKGESTRRRRVDAEENI